ncbi:ABC transporter permease [Tuanshanicoccus lijuaniae]|uniref:ABC transporter permease n=1 Tax=Aerococcaceae bacterium zg-1292 TaxID=2774330 RepID=UPI001BD82B23|nr:ABC-2 family transporter protein [Aerococcaceae bacterium zg-A91]MBS4458565.1 ABC-2 family transporter protein [Aerococcaceae bacterium zg-BR33]
MFKDLYFHISLYKSFVKMDINRIKLYPVDFLLGNLGFFVDTISSLFVLYIIMTTTSMLGEFNGYQMLFFYSFIMLANAIWEIFFVTVLEVPYMIHSGELDIFLLRPLNLLYQFVIFQLDEESVFEAIFALGLLIFSIMKMNEMITVIFVLKLVVYLISAILVKYAIYLFLSSLSFWWISNEGLKSIIWEISQLANYPLSIYPAFIRTLLVIIPFGFIGYFPVKDLVFNENLFSTAFFINSSVGILSFVLVYKTIWTLGLKKYKSVGG